MARYFLTNRAVEDLSKIWDYTYEVWSENQADIYYKLLLDCCQKLSQTPSVGKKYESIHNGLLGCKASHHIIFYRKIQLGEIEIVRILHGRMDLKNRIQE